ncbi:TetR-like C-terminal domain-containing protein [Amycolatopsis sp. 195334CR]|uniref:TetR-like C-terminal domain-containing protein n=1 Tax=Amycolatopsis sp. 195334CR TaxID=2814588 RepID=UPI001A8F4A70|nr:TetR-like C-terminal domain-containing protein [Amycolatopsis sp. 195334CR]MBN6037648.1 TetR/AcrR family transcriptional regulator C-terminal ligand-binding domain-containing protein [Amycolatopsis sp. 195334CR]
MAIIPAESTEFLLSAGLDLFLERGAEAFSIEQVARRLLRRLYGAIEDYPELAAAYRNQLGDHRDDARRAVLVQARDRGELPADTVPDGLLDVLAGAGWQHLATRPDTTSAAETEEFPRAMPGGELVIIGGHRGRRGPPAITISLFGWFVAVRGFLLIAVPNTVSSAVDATMLSPTALLLARLFFAGLAVMGLVVTYAGWFTHPRAPRAA